MAATSCKTPRDMEMARLKRLEERNRTIVREVRTVEPTPEAPAAMTYRSACVVGCGLLLLTAVTLAIVLPIVLTETQFVSD